MYWEIRATAVRKHRIRKHVLSLGRHELPVGEEPREQFQAKGHFDASQGFGSGSLAILGNFAASPWSRACASTDSCSLRGLSLASLSDFLGAFSGTGGGARWALIPNLQREETEKEQAGRGRAHGGDRMKGNESGKDVRVCVGTCTCAFVSACV